MASVTSSETEVAEIIRARGRTKQYPYPCYVNAASFISMKLVGAANYGVWQEQMMCLVESHDMIGFINGTLQNPMENGDGEDFRYADWKRSDNLVKGWIFGSLSEYVMSTVVGLLTANDVWNKLKSDYTPPPAAEFTTTSTTTTSSINLTTTANSSSFIEKDMADYLPLYRAITRNDWKKAREIFDLDKDALTVPLNSAGDRAIHIAMHKAETIELVEILENLLKEMSPESLPGLVGSNMRTPLHYAASVDNIMAAKMLVEKNPCLLFILDTDCLPIHRSILTSNRRTFLYLLDACKQHILISQQPGYHSPFEGKLGALLLTFSIASGFLDVSHELIKDYPHLAVSTCSYNNLSMVPLISIALRWDSYHSGTRYNFYQTLVNAYMPIEKDRLCDTNKIKDIENQETYKANFMTIKTCFYSVVERIYVAIWKVTLLQVSNIKHLQEEKVKHQEALLLLKSICEEVAKLNTLSDMRRHYSTALKLATDRDTPEVVEEITKYFPETHFTKFGDYNLTQIAIINRCEKVYNFLVCNMSFDKCWHQHSQDKDWNTSLHLAGRLAPLHKLDQVSGAALQMQRELQWFEEVGNYMKPKYKDWVNIRNETPIMVFRREHRQLRIDGEEWMKKTADSYTIVAALIITIVFAAAITVPGGNDGNTGKAVYETKTSFIVFAVSDAISLFSSTTSLLLFLSILTARYREEDFLYRLPKRLILGLATLFLSVSSMMVAFSATLYLMFGQGKAWILIPIATLTCLPIASFVTLQLPLLVDLISSTYGHGIFAKQSHHKMKQL